jgi:hypothetical protein
MVRSERGEGGGKNFTAECRRTRRHVMVCFTGSLELRLFPVLFKAQANE